MTNPSDYKYVRSHEWLCYVDDDMGTRWHYRFCPTGDGGSGFC